MANFNMKRFVHVAPLVSYVHESALVTSKATWNNCWRGQTHHLNPQLAQSGHWVATAMIDAGSLKPFNQ